MWLCHDDALNHTAILHGNAGRLLQYDIRAVFPDKVANFPTNPTAFEFAAWTVTRPPNLKDRSQFHLQAAGGESARVLIILIYFD